MSSPGQKTSDTRRPLGALLVLLAASIVLNLVLGFKLVTRGTASHANKSEDEGTVDHLLLQVRCGKGDKEACDEVERLDDTECASGKGHACTLVAIGYETGRQRPKDEAKAASFYVKACDLGDASGCWYAGSRYTSGRGVEKDVDRAHGFLVKACDGKEVNGCLDLGYAYDRAQPPQKDKALEAWDRGCTLGYDSACRAAKDARSR